MSSILKETIDQMSNEATIDIASIINDAGIDIPNILMGSDDIDTCCGKENEEEARNEMNKRSREKMNNVSSDIRDYLSEIFIRVKTQLNDAAKISTSCIKQKKDEFINHISREVNKSIDQLEEQIKNREKNISLLESAISKLDEIHNQL